MQFSVNEAENKTNKKRKSLCAVMPKGQQSNRQTLLTGARGTKPNYSTRKLLNLSGYVQFLEWKINDKWDSMKEKILNTILEHCVSLLVASVKALLSRSFLLSFNETPCESEKHFGVVKFGQYLKYRISCVSNVRSNTIQIRNPFLKAFC